MSNDTLSTVEFQLNKGCKTIVDAQDSDLATRTWRSIGRTRSRYVARRYRVNGHVLLEYLHNVILERKIGRSLVDGEYADHIDLNPFNNTRKNLRIATYIQNCQNRRKRSDNTSGYKGVSKRRYNNKWVAVIYVNGKQRNLGMYDTPELAYEAYCKAAVELFGDFARLE